MMTSHFQAQFFLIYFAHLTSSPRHSFCTTVCGVRFIGSVCLFVFFPIYLDTPHFLLVLSLGERVLSQAAGPCRCVVVQGALVVGVLGSKCSP